LDPTHTPHALHSPTHRAHPTTNPDANANSHRQLEPGRGHASTVATDLAVSGEDELSAKERARIRARERKARRPKMVVDNAVVKRIQAALRNRSSEKKK